MKKQSENLVLKEGDMVRWTSQSGAYETTKQGAVMQVVPSGERPDRERFGQLYRGSGVGGPRDHESYVIQTQKPKRLYWPRVRHLSLVQSALGEREA